MNQVELEKFTTDELLALRNGFDKMLDEAYKNKDLKVVLFADEARLLITSIIWERNVALLEDMVSEGSN